MKHPMTTTADTATAAHPTYPLTWLRGIAALVVVIFHAYQHNRSGPEAAWPWDGVKHQLMLGSDAFVDMFFVLSGLVLWLPITRAALEGRTERPGRVLLYRRMARLLPLYYLVVLGVWALSNPVFPGEHWGDLLLHLTFLHVYSDQYVFWTDGPAWSLGVEFHFYVLMALAVPLLHAAVRRTASRRARVAVAAALPAACVVVGVTYLAWATLLDPQQPDNWSIWFSPLSRATDFGVGMGLAVLAAAGVRLRSWLRGSLAVGGTGAVIVLVLVRPFDTIQTEWWHPAFAVSMAVGLAAIVLHPGPWPAVLDRAPLVRLGVLGYGIYLLHEPVMRVLDAWSLLPAARPGPAFLVVAVLVAVPTVALAWLSARTVERAGVLVLGTIDRRGRPRDYYDHLEPDDRPERTVGSPVVGAGR